jgi:predicted Ser/Thr protein kinase
MAQFSVLTRLKEPENSSIYSKMLIYDGENLKDTDPKAKSYQEYRDYAGVDEGMNGISTRFAFKIISKVFNFGSEEVAANPVHLMYVLEQQIEREQFPAETERNSSARKSRRPTWSPTPSTARTSSTATSPTPTSGSRTRNSATRTRARSSTAPR